MTPPDDERSSTVVPPRTNRGRHRRRRQTYTFVGLFTSVVLIGVVAFGNWQQWWTLGGRAATVSAYCPTQIFTSPRMISVRVFNGTQRRGLAAAVGNELEKRGFTVITIGNEPLPKPIDSVVLIRYGPPGAQAARTVALQFPRRVKLIKNDKNSRTVEVVIG